MGCNLSDKHLGNLGPSRPLGWDLSVCHLGFSLAEPERRVVDEHTGSRWQLFPSVLIVLDRLEWDVCLERFGRLDTHLETIISLKANSLAACRNGLGIDHHPHNFLLAFLTSSAVDISSLLIGSERNSGLGIPSVRNSALSSSPGMSSRYKWIS